MRNSEFGERIEHQSATIDVLKVMSASPGDPQPVFELIVRRAARTMQSRVRGLVRIRWFNAITFGSMSSHEA